MQRHQAFYLMSNKWASIGQMLIIKTTTRIRGEHKAIKIINF